ncbi:MAG: hypothetical protein WC222_08060 [Parachlamydiales bacterium]|jgi:hypothetical protein
MSQEAAAAASVAPGAQTVEADATTAANAVSSNGGTKESVSGSDTSFSSLGELRRKYPKLYDLMLQGSMTTFFKRQNDSNERIKQENKKHRDS